MPQTTWYPPEYRFYELLSEEELTSDLMDARYGYSLCVDEWCGALPRKWDSPSLSVAGFERECPPLASLTANGHVPSQRHISLFGVPDIEDEAHAAVRASRAGLVESGALTSDDRRKAAVALMGDGAEREALLAEREMDVILDRARRTLFALAECTHALNVPLKAFEAWTMFSGRPDPELVLAKRRAAYDESQSGSYTYNNPNDLQDSWCYRRSLMRPPMDIVAHLERALPATEEASQLRDVAEVMGILGRQREAVARKGRQALATAIVAQRVSSVADTQAAKRLHRSDLLRYPFSLRESRETIALVLLAMKLIEHDFMVRATEIYSGLSDWKATLKGKFKTRNIGILDIGMLEISEPEQRPPLPPAFLHRKGAERLSAKELFEDIAAEMSLTGANISGGSVRKLVMGLHEPAQKMLDELYWHDAERAKAYNEWAERTKARNEWDAGLQSLASEGGRRKAREGPVWTGANPFDARAPMPRRADYAFPSNRRRAADFFKLAEAVALKANPLKHDQPLF